MLTMNALPPSIKFNLCQVCELIQRELYGKVGRNGLNGTNLKA